MRMLIRLVLPVLVACNGKPLESGNLHYDSLGVETGAVDADGDGYLEHEDCDDEDPTVYPGAEELCDGEDNDCDGGVDEGLSSAPYYMDRDGDGYGSGEPAGEDCGAPDGYSMEDGDCDDQDASVFPGAEETPCDRVDGDCDGVGNEAYQAAVEGVEYEDLQAAIDAAPYDGTVYVCPGAHQASLVIEPAQRLTLASWSASAEDTVLSGDGIDRILEVGEHVQLAIHGLGFRDGLADWKDEYLVACGGSIAGLNVDLEVVGCHFDSSHAEDAGGAICAAWNGDAGNVSTISLQDVVFDGNYAQASGGALAAFSGEDAEAVVSVVDSGFTGNETMGNGGAVYLQSSDTDRLTASIEDSTFTNNTTRLGGDGGALYWKGSPDETLSINDTTFASNIAGHWGGAIHWYTTSNSNDPAPSNLVLQDVSFQDNSSYEDAGAIGLAYSTHRGERYVLDIQDSSFTENHANGEGGVFAIASDHVVLEVVRTSFVGNSAGTQSGVFFHGGEAVTAEYHIEECTFSNNGAPQAGLGSLSLDGEASLLFTDSEILDNVSGTADPVFRVSASEPNALSFVRTTIDGNQGGGEASFLDLTNNGGPVSLSLEDSAITSNVSSNHAAAVIVRTNASVNSTNTDWGTDSTDNETCDLMLQDIYPPIDDVELCDLGTNETFTCPGDGECYW